MADDYLMEIYKEIENQFHTCGIEPICEEAEKNEELVAMRDGVQLRTFIWKPCILKESYPVIFTRTCYPEQEPIYDLEGRELAKRGYIFVYQYCRGRGGSEGEWIPNVNERNDGIDTMNWLAGQKWSDAIGYWGASYTSMTGWAFADVAKGKVASMYLKHYGTDRFCSAYQKNSFRQDVLTSWSMQNAKEPILAGIDESYRFMPQVDVEDVLWKQKSGEYYEYITNTKLTDSYWQNGWWKTLREIPAKVEIPIYVVSGWYDHHHGSSMKTWERLSEESKKHSILEIGAWNHGQFACLDGRDMEHPESHEIKTMLEWFHMTLVEKKTPSAQILLYECNEDHWMKFDSLEKLKKREKVLFFSAADNNRDGKLTEEVEKTSEISYEYHPDNPVKSQGSESLLCDFFGNGSKLQLEPGYREDVISFISKPLPKEMSICGKMKISLFVKTDAEDTAFTAKVSQVMADGRTYNIRSSITTIAADLPEGTAYNKGSVVEVYIEMWDIFYHLSKGDCIRIDISSSDYPQYNIHSNHAGIWSLQTDNIDALQTILTGKEYPSVIRIPVLDEEN